MATTLFDADALITQFENATAQQGEQLRKAASAATLQALQGRALSLKNIRTALQAVADAAGAGAARNALPGVDMEELLDKAVAGMDDALLRAVDANRLALGQLVARGADLRDKQLKKALADMEKFEDTLFASLRKTAEGAGAQLSGPWEQVLQKMQPGGTLAGTKASATVEQLMNDMQAAMRQSRSSALRAAQVLAESYTAMVSGVLLGMSEALQQSSARPAAPADRKKS